MKTPIFLFSLPRSGSTLLQRILMGHPEIASTSETWILLPLLYACKKEGTLTEYSHITSHRAFLDFRDSLPGRRAEYNQILMEFVMKLYTRQCKCNETYFLDKTPRYYLIIKEIADLFPDAKFIFLFRNPVQVYSSFLTTFDNNRLKGIHQYEMDLIEGPKLLSEGYELLKDHACALRYDDLTADPEESIKKILSYLELEYHNEMINNFTRQRFNSGISDQTGVRDYNTINSAPLEKWKSTFGTALRKQILSRYIRNFKDITLQIQGYSKHDILKDIDSLPALSKGVLLDSADYLAANLKLVLHSNLFFTTKLFGWVRNRYIS